MNYFRRNTRGLCVRTLPRRMGIDSEAEQIESWTDGSFSKSNRTSVTDGSNFIVEISQKPPTPKRKQQHASLSIVVSTISDRSSFLYNRHIHIYFGILVILLSIPFIAFVSPSPSLQAMDDVLTLNHEAILDDLTEANRPAALLLAKSLAQHNQDAHLSNDSVQTEAKAVRSPSESRIVEQASTKSGSNDSFPLSLPLSHPDAKLLLVLRQRTLLRPRWPKHGHLDVDHLRSYGPAFSSIIVSHKLKVVYIPVFRAGMAALMSCIGYLEENKLFAQYVNSSLAERNRISRDASLPVWQKNRLADMTDEQIQSIMNDPTYLKFGFVRNPFDRVISAFVDRIETPKMTSAEYQHQMYSLYGTDPVVRATTNESRPSFDEFLRAIHNVLLDPRTSLINSVEGSLSGRDPHWRPQTELLHPDLIPFDFIGRFERIESDVKLVLEWMQRHSNRRLPLDWLKLPKQSNGRRRAELFKELYLDEDVRGLVTQIYADDFSQFQFSKHVPKLM